MILNCENVKSLMNLKHNKHQLAILNRQTPENSNVFFSELNITSFSTSGYVSLENSLNDISKLTEEKLPSKIRKNLFFEKWLNYHQL